MMDLMAAPRLGAQIGLVRLHHACQLGEVVPLSGLADAMAHEPRRLVRDIQHPVQLVSADALLGRAHEVDGRQPLMEGNLAVLEDRPDRGGELALAAAALVERPDRVLAGGLPGDGVGLGSAALGTLRPVGPAEALEERPGLLVSPAHHLVERTGGIHLLASA